jgi:hypothetical protein
MSPRIIHIPLSGGDRKAQPKGMRYPHGIHNSYFKESVLTRSAAEAKIREADRLECEAWNAIMWAGGPAMPSPGEPQARAQNRAGDKWQLCCGSSELSLSGISLVKANESRLNEDDRARRRNCRKNVLAGTFMPKLIHGRAETNHYKTTDIKSELN